MKTNRSIILVTMMLLPFASNAQGLSDVMETPWITNTALLYSFYVIIAVLLLISLLLFRVMSHMQKYIAGELGEESAEAEEERTNKFRGIERFLQLKPLSSDKDTVMEDHDYDGIHELDNPPPPWFMFLFYGTILFAVVYLTGYTWTGSWPNQEEEYQAQVEEAEALRVEALAASEASIDESNVVASTDAEDIAAGKAIFVSKCVVCHLDGGKGMTGPNLTDDYWVHGGSDADIFKTIKYGIVEKGMIAWQDQLTPKMMQDVVSYIQSLEYVSPEEGGKAPEGEKYQAESESAPSDDANTASDSSVTDEGPVSDGDDVAEVTDENAVEE